MYNRGKDLLKALARIAGTGGNRKLHFQGRRKIIHSGIPTSPCRNTSTACEDTFEENPNTVTKQLNFFFLGTSPNPAHAGDCLLSESSLCEIPAPVPPPGVGSTKDPPIVPALMASDPGEEPTVERVHFSAWFVYGEGGKGSG